MRRLCASPANRMKFGCQDLESGCAICGLRAWDDGRSLRHVAVASNGGGCFQRNGAAARLDADLASPGAGGAAFLDAGDRRRNSEPALIYSGLGGCVDQVVWGFLGPG